MLESKESDELLDHGTDDLSASDEEVCVSILSELVINRFVVVLIF